MKTFIEFLNETRVGHKPVVDFMHGVYRGVAPDLPRHGNYHFDAAVDYLSDRAHDEFGKTHAGLNFKHHAAKVVRHYAENDTALSNRRDKAKHSPKKKPAPRVAKVKSWDSFKPKNKGIGSY